MIKLPLSASNSMCRLLSPLTNFVEKSLKQSLYYTTGFNLKNALNLISDCRYLFCMILGINSD